MQSDLKEARTRIGNVKWKTDGKIVVLPQAGRKAGDNFKKQAMGMAAQFTDDMAGFAIVIWGKDKSSVAAIETGEPVVIPSIMVPDFVRERLMARLVMNWVAREAD